MKPPAFVQVYDGEWFQPRTRKWLMKCCDCGLVHSVDHRVRQGKIQMRAFRITRKKRK